MSYPHYTNDCDGFHDLVVDFEGVMPDIVVLCGSTRFRDEFTEQNRRLTQEGAIVVAPGVFGHDGDPFTEADKVRLDALHKRKIELAHEVFVVNPALPDFPGGYIGESTRKEIEYAEKLGKPIRYLVEQEAVR